MSYVLYMYKPSSSKAKYPDILLPGNVTIGTSYEDTVKVYGKDVLHKYDGKNDAVNKLGFQDTCSIYTVDLNNDLNHLYLIYDSDGKLTALRWQYTDINNYLNEK